MSKKMQDTPDFKEIDEARKTLDLGENATLKEIKEAYKELIKKYHPDKCRGTQKKKCEEQMKKINEAYRHITEYCRNYRYPFTREEVEDPHTEYIKGFGEDWMWSPKKTTERGKKNDHRGI